MKVSSRDDTNVRVDMAPTEAARLVKFLERSHVALQRMVTDYDLSATLRSEYIRDIEFCRRTIQTLTPAPSSPAAQAKDALQGS